MCQNIFRVLVQKEFSDEFFLETVETPDSNVSEKEMKILHLRRVELCFGLVWFCCVCLFRGRDGKE